MKFSLSGKIDINSFFRKGFATAQLPKDQADFLLALARAQEFVPGDGFYAGDNFDAPLITAWEEYKVIPSENLDAPTIFRQYWHDLATSPFLDWFHRSFGPFSQGCPMINYYKKDSGMVWHSDCNDASYITCCTYLTKDEFSVSDGGYLGIGDCKLNEENQVQNSTVQLKERILPNHGVVVFVNNLDTTHLHRVERMLTDKERITLLCHFGYAENTLTRARLKVIRGIDAS